MSIRILPGNCLKTMATLAAGSVHAVVTSPPYWGLRNYGTPDLDWPAIDYSPMAGLPPCVSVPAMTCSLGLEPTLEAFIGHIVLIFREARRVLRDDGSMWVNMGDSYAGGRAGPSNGSLVSTRRSAAAAREGRAAQRSVASRRRDREEIPRSDIKVPGLKSKDMMGQPWRVAFALQADGWWLRRDVIWDKCNPMPESSKDRPTTAHEYLFLLAKSERYYFDHDAIKEPGSPETHARYARGRSDDHKNAGAALVPGQRPQTIAQGYEHMRKPIGGWAKGGGDHQAISHNVPEVRNNGVGWGHGTPDGEKPRTVGRKADTALLEGAAGDGKSARLGREAGWRKAVDAPDRTKNNAGFDAAMRHVLPMRAKRSVWRLPTEAVKDAHFATFPTALVEPCILASCPPGGVTLDMFGGSGTVGLVADRNRRSAILCELSPAYIQIMRRRLTRESPLLTHLED